MTLVIIFAILALIFDVFLIFLLGIEFSEQVRYYIRKKGRTQGLWLGAFYVLGMIINVSIISLYLYYNLIINYV